MSYYETSDDPTTTQHYADERAIREIINRLEAQNEIPHYLLDLGKFTVSSTAYVPLPIGLETIDFNLLN